MASVRVAPPPRGWGLLAGLGPGFLWMVSATGSGELLFTPRIGSLYGYSLLWALLASVVLKWFINREVGRYTVCTGATVLEGFHRLPGTQNWAVWLIVLPQLVVAVATIAGLAGSSATALVLVLPGDIRLWTIASLLTATGLVMWGRYRVIELTATVLALLLAVASVVAATRVFPGWRPLIEGMTPRVPDALDYGEILPWLGFMLSGAAGMMWYSYWVRAKGYGAEPGVASQPLDPGSLTQADQTRLRGWLTQMTWDNSAAVVGTTVVTLAFLVLGTELLRPKGLVPSERQAAEVLGHLLGEIWGPAGFWFMVLGVYVGLWDTILSDQDGFARLFADGTQILLRPFGLQGRWSNDLAWRRAYVLVLLTIIPALVYLVSGAPLFLLKLAGGIEAAHIPVLTFLILYLNCRDLPPGLRPGRLTVAATSLAGIFFAVFALVYVVRLMATRS